MKKFYKLMEDRNEEEKRTGKASYKSIIDRYFNNMLLCNNILEIDDELLYNIELGSIYDYLDNEGNYRTHEEYENDETGEIYEECCDIYQYFLTDLNYYDVEHLRNLVENDEESPIILAYSNKLDMYVLLVTHFGTGWDYVQTSIELTENFDEA